MNNLPVPLISLTERTLQRLASQFTVRDIMISATDLIKAKTEEQAFRFLEIYSEFDLIPLETENQITAYIERGEPNPKSIGLDMIIGNGCSIIELIDVLAVRECCFVSGKGGVEGYIHFSDLNHNLVDLPFYILSQAVETRIISLIQGRFNEDNLHKVFDAQNKDIAKNIIDRFNKYQANNADKSLLNFVMLDKMLMFARYFGLLELTDDEIRELYTMRNSLAHIPERLIQRHADVERLRQTKNLCYNVLSSSISPPTTT